MKNLKLFIALPLLGIIYSCSLFDKSLTEMEKQILIEKAPMYYYEEDLKISLYSWIEYTDECFDAYYNRWLDEFDGKINSFFGDIYYDYGGGRRDVKRSQDYVSKVMDISKELTNTTADKFANIIAKSLEESDYRKQIENESGILFIEEDSEIDEDGSFNMGKIGTIKGMPKTADVEAYINYRDILSTIDLEQPSLAVAKEMYGEIPNFNYNSTFTAAAFLRIAYLKALQIPRPQYAWYDEERMRWEVGFSNDRALAIKFNESDDTVYWQIEGEIRYDINKMDFTIDP